MAFLDPSTSSDFGDAIRRRIGKPKPEPDPFAGFSGLGDALSGIGSAIGGTFQKAHELPVVGGAMDALGAIGDATVKTPVGLAALGADQFLGTGLTDAANRANAGRPFWELPKTATNVVTGAFGDIAGDTSQPAPLRALAGLTHAGEQIGEFVAPIPGAGQVAGLIGRGASRLPSALEHTVGEVAPGAGLFGPRASRAITAERRAPKIESPVPEPDLTQALKDSIAQQEAKRADPLESARQQIADAQARQRANPTPAEELATRYPTSVTDLEHMLEDGKPIAGLKPRGEMPRRITTDDTLTADLEASLRARGVEPPAGEVAPTYTKRAPSIKGNMEELRANAIRQRIAGPSPSGAVAPETALGERMLGNESGIVAASARGESWVTPELLNKHYANEALTNAAKSGDVAAAREALQTLESLGASASNTAKHLRDAGVPLPRGATFAHIREALMPKPITDTRPLRPQAPKAARPVAVVDAPSPLTEAIRTRAKSAAPAEPAAPLPEAAPLTPAAAPSNVIPIESHADFKAKNADTLKQLNERIAAARALAEERAARNTVRIDLREPTPPGTPPTGPGAPTTTGATPPTPPTPPAPSTGLDKFLSVWNLPKSLKASLDFSAPFRQGVLLSAGHPGEFFGAFKPMIQAAKDAKFAAALDDSIRTVERPGLYLAPLDATKIGAREEAFMSTIADKIPGVSGSNRAYVTFLNKLRADVYDNVIAGWEKGGKEVAEADRLGLANVINHFTGRGDLPMSGATGTAVLNGMFFSPRFAISRVQSVGDALGALKSPGSLAAREAAADMTKFVGAGLTILTLAQLAGAKVELDPRSPGFGKIQVGSTSVDIWGGEQQMARYATQLITGQKVAGSGKHAGDVQDVRRDETLGRLVRSKLAPATGAINDVLGVVGGGGATAKDRKENAGRGFFDQVIGRDFVGQPVTPGGLPGSLSAPLGWSDTLDAAKQGSPLGALSLIGFGVQTRDQGGQSAPTPTTAPFKLTAPGAPSGAPPGQLKLVPPGPVHAPAEPAAPPFKLTPPGGTMGGKQLSIAAPGEVADVISTAARQSGIDPLLALAVAQQESGFNPQAVGDNGDSHGLFQENVNGRGHGRAPDYDPARQTARFAADVRAALAAGFRGTPGQLAAAVQRPYDPVGYARSVDAIYGSL